MTRALQVIIVTLAAITCAACSLPTRFKWAKQKHELRMVMSEWGVNPDTEPLTQK